MPVLDSTFLVDAVREPDLMARVAAWALDRGEALVVPMQAAVEYASGTQDPSAELRALDEAFVLRPFDLDVAAVAARMAREHRRSGRRLGWADEQIAATAVQDGMHLLTADRRLLDLGIATWDYRRDATPPPH